MHSGPLLLDTVAFVFWHPDGSRLFSTARAALPKAPQRALYVSAVTSFEIATKVRLGKLTVPPSILNDFAYVVDADDFRLLDIDAPSAIGAALLTGQHRDPFDRLPAHKHSASGRQW